MASKIEIIEECNGMGIEPSEVRTGDILTMIYTYEGTGTTQITTGRVTHSPIGKPTVFRIEGYGEVAWGSSKRRITRLERTTPDLPPEPRYAVLFPSSLFPAGVVAGRTAEQGPFHWRVGGVTHTWKALLEKYGDDFDVLEPVANTLDAVEQLLRSARYEAAVNYLVRARPGLEGQSE